MCNKAWVVSYNSVSPHCHIIYKIFLSIAGQRCAEPSLDTKPCALLPICLFPKRGPLYALDVPVLEIAVGGHQIQMSLVVPNEEKDEEEALAAWHAQVGAQTCYSLRLMSQLPHLLFYCTCRAQTVTRHA